MTSRKKQSNFQIATICNELKTERAQTAVDARRAVFDASAKRAEGQQRASAALARALEQVLSLFKPGQRARLAHLIRTGVVAF